MTSSSIKNINSHEQEWLDLYLTSGAKNWSEDPPPFIETNLKEILRPSMKVLEIGAGDGRITSILVKWGVKLDVLDISPESINLLRNNFEKHGLELPTLIEGSATKSPLGDSQYNAIVSIDVIGQIYRCDLMMKEVHRQLRSGGIFCFNIYTPQDSTYGLGEQIGAQDFLYKGTLFRYFTVEQFSGIFKNLFSIKKMQECVWSDPPHGDYRVEPHTHHSIFYTLEKI